MNDISYEDGGAAGTGVEAKVSLVELLFKVGPASAAAEVSFAGIDNALAESFDIDVEMDSGIGVGIRRQDM